jgi:hypothetical protein
LIKATNTVGADRRGGVVNGRERIADITALPREADIDGQTELVVGAKPGSADRTR